MRKNLVIYGTVFGPSVYLLAQKYCGWNVIGFLDDTLPVGTNIIDGLLTLEPDRVFSSKEKQGVVVSVSDPFLKEKLIDNLLHKFSNIYLPSLISPKAIVSDYSRIGNGCIVNHFTIVDTGVILADNILLDVRVTVGHGTQIGKFSTISASSHISGNTIIGEKCFCGAMSFVMQKRKIGDNVVIAAGSAVFTDIQSNVTVMGNPAAILRKN